jgi:hypothetical protein
MAHGVSQTIIVQHLLLPPYIPSSVLRGPVAEHEMCSQTRCNGRSRAVELFIHLFVLVHKVFAAFFDNPQRGAKHDVENVEYWSLIYGLIIASAILDTLLLHLHALQIVTNLEVSSASAKD